MFSDAEIQYMRDEAIRGIDANHTPRLIVPEIYIERRSERLLGLAARALLYSQMYPDTQYDVVWLSQRPRRFLRAEIQPTGTFDLGDNPYGGGFGIPIPGTRHRYIPDIARIESGIGHSYTYSGRIDAALENGAGIFKPADLGPNKHD